MTRDEYIRLYEIAKKIHKMYPGAKHLKELAKEIMVMVENQIGQLS